MVPWAHGPMGPWSHGPKMVLGHNLQHMAPFEILEAGFCTVFRRASFWFSVPGVKSGTPDPGLGTGWAWRLWDPPRGSTFVEGWFSHKGERGGPKGEWILGAWRPLWAGPFPLNPPWKNGFTGISPFSQFPPGPWPGPVWALCGPCVGPVWDLFGPYWAL